MGRAAQRCQGWDRWRGDGDMSEIQGKGRRQVWMEEHLRMARKSKGWQGASEVQEIFMWKVNKGGRVCVGGEGCSRG